MTQFMIFSMNYVPVKFWIELYNGEEYKELSSLALHLPPTSVICM